jgi:hypothetical protein
MKQDTAYPSNDVRSGFYKLDNQATCTSIRKILNLPNTAHFNYTIKKSSQSVLNNAVFLPLRPLRLCVT